MANGKPCPNPTCTHVFPAASIKGASALKCPQCGKAFKLKAVPKAAAAFDPYHQWLGISKDQRPPTLYQLLGVAPEETDLNVIEEAARQRASHVRSFQSGPHAEVNRRLVKEITQALMVLLHPAQRQEYDAQLLAQSCLAAGRTEAPAGAEDSEEAFAPPPRSVPTVKAKGRSRASSEPGEIPWVKITVWCSLLGIMVGLGIWLIPRFQMLLKEKPIEPLPPATQVHNSKDYNFRFALPGSPWQRDDPARITVKAESLAMSRTSPTCWFAIGAKDYKTRTPRSAELIDELTSRLEMNFTQLESEIKGEAQLSGLRAQRLVFQGVVNNVMMSGECLTTAYQGIGYWFITWAPASEITAAAKYFPDLRQRFSLLKERGSWRENRPPLMVFQGKKSPYQLRDSEGLWTSWDDPKDKDPEADLALLGKDRIEPQDVGKSAWVMVLVLNRPGTTAQTALAAARAHLEEQYKAIHGKTKMDILTEQDETPTNQVGSASGQVVKLHVKNGESQNLFVMLAVVPRPDHVLVIQCECDLKRRGAWEGEFQQLLQTFSW